VRLWEKRIQDSGIRIQDSGDRIQGRKDKRIKIKGKKKYNSTKKHCHSDELSEEESPGRHQNLK